MTDSEKPDLILDKIEGMEQKVAGLDQKVKELDQKVAGLDQKVAGLSQDVAGLDQKVDVLETDMQDVKQKLTKVDLTLDNEIRTNIKRVAEGHLDLSRNLHEAIKHNNKMEMMAIRVGVLETEVRDFKQNIC